MKTCKAVFFVSKSGKHNTFINFIKNAGLSVQIKIVSSFSSANTENACLVFVDKETASIHGSKLAEIKESRFHLLPLLLLLDDSEKSDSNLQTSFF